LWSRRAKTRRPTLVGTTDVTWSMNLGTADEVLPVVHDDHRTVFEVADALPVFLAGTGERDADEVAGHDRRCELLREPPEVARGHALQLGVAREWSVVGEQPELEAAGERDELASTASYSTTSSSST